MEKIKVLIIDDELPALEVLQALLKRRSEFEVVLATQDYDAAVECLDENEIELVIVDLGLRGGRSGYDLMALVERPAQIIVCTATDNEGTQSIAAGAIEYVVKPVDGRRFDQALDRVLEQLELLERARRQQQSYPPTIAVQCAVDDAANRFEFLNIDVSQLVYARSDAKCVRLFLNDGRDILVRKLMLELQELLDPKTFIRVQRGYIVNQHEINTYYSSIDSGKRKCWVSLKTRCEDWDDENDKGKLPVGEGFRLRLERAIGIK